MRRFFGGSGAPRPRADLEATAGKLDARSDELAGKVARCDADLLRLKAQMQRAPGNEGLRRQAMAVLHQKRAYEQQLALVQGQALNVQSASFAKQNLALAAETTDAMRAAGREMRAQLAAVSVDAVADMQDDLAEMVAQSAEVSEALAQSYAAPADFVSDADLEAELGMLEAETGVSDASYLDVAIPTGSPYALPAREAPGSVSRGHESPLLN